MFVFQLIMALALVEPAADLIAIGQGPVNQQIAVIVRGDLIVEGVPATKAKRFEGSDTVVARAEHVTAVTNDDLTRSWNPGIKKHEDRPAFSEPMPTTTLPPPTRLRRSDHERPNDQAPPVSNR